MNAKQKQKYLRDKAQNLVVVDRLNRAFVKIAKSMLIYKQQQEQKKKEFLEGLN